MTERQRRPGSGGRSLTRRRLLTRGLLGAFTLTGVAGLPAMTGCTVSDPLVDTASPSVTGRPPSIGSPSSSGSAAAPDPTGTAAAPTGAPPADGSAAGEQALAALAAAILAGPHHRELSAAQRRSLAAVREGHRQHVVALTTAGTAPSPTATPPSGFARLRPAKAVELLAGREQQQAARLRHAALSADGHDALLRGSMMVAATGYAAALRGRRETAVVARPPEPATAAVSDVAALQSVVRQLHALVYGYQLALGQLSESSPAGRRALAALAARRRLRDRLEGILVARSATVPAAAGAYVPLVQPTSAKKSAALIRRMETAFQPFCGLWLASAARAEDRRLALDALADTAAAAQSWGAAVRPWPGWAA